MSPARHRLFILVLAAAVFVSLAAFMSLSQRAALRAAAQAAAQASAPVPPAPRPVPPVARTLRALKLITVEVESSVVVTESNDSWRGNVAATVAAPVTYYYGVDLSALSESDIGQSPFTGGIRLRVPPPRRLAVEVFTGDQQADVKLGWGRLRDRAGEYYLGLARTRLHEQAASAPLAVADRVKIEQATRDQLSALVRALAGPDVPVIVEFAPPEASPLAEAAP